MTKQSLSLILLCRRHSHSMSTLYRPITVITKGPEKDKGQPQTLSKSARLMVDNGIIRTSSVHGAFHFLPMGLRALEKLMAIVDKFMGKAQCQKIQMPILTSTSLWNTTGRLDECRQELMVVSDRHDKEYLLSPTHEEAICDLVNSYPLSYRQLPLRLYQMTDKFRDEKRPRFGLMRSRQFLMKDLYTFDSSEEASRKTYQELLETYQQLFAYLGLNFVKAIGCSGTIGGNLSHEFHLLSEVGEDRLLHCSSCRDVFNQEFLAEVEMSEKVEVAAGGSSGRRISVPKCITCGSENVVESKSIEIGHAFLLGTKYSKPFKTSYSNQEGGQELMEMGCFGIGMTRLLAAIVETMSTEKEIRWPATIAPFFLTVIPPKAGSKEEKIGKHLTEKVLSTLDRMFGAEILVDDRLDQTVGRRLLDAKKLGLPYIAVFGKSVNPEEGPSRIELHDVNSGDVQLLGEKEIIGFMYDAHQKTILQ